MATSDEILHYWFADTRADPDKANERKSWWFEKGEELDAEIERCFGEDVHAAASGGRDGWGEEARPCLALILLLDQFPRHIHRGSGRAFENDAKAVHVVRQGARQGFVESLSPPEQCFFLTPFMHSERLADQQLGIELLERCARHCDPLWHAYVQSTCDYASAHAAVIRRFGRFPHRNAALDRTPTPDERDYLRGGGDTWGQ